MTPLEKLFLLEVQFHRRLRTDVPDTVETQGLHTSYALATGYEHLISSVGRVTTADVETLSERFLLAGDARDVASARDSVMQILRVLPLEVDCATRFAKRRSRPRAGMVESREPAIYPVGGKRASLPDGGSDYPGEGVLRGPAYHTKG